MSNYVASTACLGTVLTLKFPVILTILTCLHVVHREFLKIKFTKYAQIQFIAIILTFPKCVQYRIGIFMCFLSDLNIFNKFTQNWVEFFIFSSVETYLP